MSLSWLAPVPYQTYRDLRRCHQHHPWCLGRHQDCRAQQPTATDVVPTPRHAAGASALVASTSGAATGARQRRSCRCLLVQKNVSDLQWSLAVGCCLPSSNRKPNTRGLGPTSCKSVHQAHMTRRPRLRDAPHPHDGTRTTRCDAAPPRPLLFLAKVRALHVPVSHTTTKGRLPLKLPNFALCTPPAWCPLVSERSLSARAALTAPAHVPPAPPPPWKPP